MGSKLLVRSYFVGCGDCIYVHIPAPDDFHILIDCGKKGDAKLLEEAIEHLARTTLPPGSKPGTKRLDLIVATHRHEDHIKGFDPKWFKNIEVKHIWLSAVMDPNHAQAKGVNELHSLAKTAMRALIESGRPLDPQVELLTSLYGVSNDVADECLMDELPKLNNLKPKFVSSGMSAKSLGVKLKTADIHVLAPERDIDGYYLGKDFDESLKGMMGIRQSLHSKNSVAAAAAPGNVSAADFRLLQSRMLSNGLAFAARDTTIQNNMSVVLLIEWNKKRRLLFVGDAEWEGEYRLGKHNGSWNVMWEKHRKTHLKASIDFLKIGHHASVNATPPRVEKQSAAAKAKLGKNEPSVYQILDTLLPVPKAGKKPTAQAIVSTEREFYNPIPDCDVLVDLARRVKNVSNYGARLKSKGIKAEEVWSTPKAKRNKFFDKYEKEFLDKPQPTRTDLECLLTGSQFVEVEIDP
jgi:beta-lactamase superfamily II metal-dependent hydrolase